MESQYMPNALPINQVNPEVMITTWEYLDRRQEEKVAKAVPVVIPVPLHSEKMDQIIAALALAKLEVEAIKVNQKNGFFKSSYADLYAVNNVIAKPLAKQGLVILQPTYTTEDGQRILKTILFHSSGQWLSSEVRLVLAKDDFQGYGSALSYLRRYQICSLLSLAIDDREDDDAEVAQADHRNAKVTGTRDSFTIDKTPKEPITPAQLEDMEELLEGHADIAENILKSMNLLSLADFPAAKYKWGMDRIRTFIINKGNRTPQKG